MQDLVSGPTNPSQANPGPAEVDPKALAHRMMQRAHNRDGVPEIAIGVAFIVQALLVFLQSLQPAGSIVYKGLALALAVFVPAVGLTVGAVIQRFRRHYLLDRFGYLETRRVGLRSMLFGIVFAAMLAVLIGLIFRFSVSDQWVLAGAGILGGALAAFCGKLPRFIVHGGLIATIGLMAAYERLSLLLGFALMFGLSGIAILVSGSVVFARFMRQSGERSK